MSFEIVTANGTRFRYSAPRYRWQFALKPGTLDVEDKTVVEVFRVCGDEEELCDTFSQVIAVGDVSWDTTLIMLPEKRVTQCPKCGFEEIE